MRRSDLHISEKDVLRAALDGLLTRYVTLASSGDCGFWDPEEEEEVVNARAALASTRGQSVDPNANTLNLQEQP